MVERMEKKFNKPIGKVREFPIFWLTELRKSKWMCQSCKGRQEPGSVALELCVRRAVKGWKGAGANVQTTTSQSGVGVPFRAAMKQWLSGGSSNSGHYNSDGGVYQEQFDKAVKVFICLECGQKLLSDALARVETVKKFGVKGYRFIDEV